jgi:hypothetical protein
MGIRMRVATILFPQRNIIVCQIIANLPNQ